MKRRIEESILARQNNSSGANSPARLRNNNHSRTSSLQLKQDYEVLTSGQKVGSVGSGPGLILQESLGEIRDAVVEMEDRVAHI